MYTSTDDARSDLFLAGAVYLFGGIILGVLLRLVPLGRLPLVAPLLAITLPLVTTVLVPFLLIRYRRDPWSLYGLERFRLPAIGYGVLLAVPVMIGGLVAVAVAGLELTTAIPLTWVGGDGGVDFLSRVARWLGYTLLAAYGTVKARDAFRGDSQPLVTVARQVGGVLVVAVAAATSLLLLSMAAGGAFLANLDLVVGYLLVPLGVVTAVVLALSSVPAHTVATRPTLITPAVLLGLAGFHLRLDAVALVFTVYLTAILALLGLLVGVLQESRRTAWAAAGLGLAIAALTVLGQGAVLR